MGGQTTGGEVVWNDDVSLDEIGSSPMLSVSSDSSSYPVHLGAIEGAGGGGAGSHGSGKSYSEGEFEIWSPRVSYSGDKFVLRGDSFSITCILTQFDQLKWTLDETQLNSYNGK
ncbi:hypothetical protein Avbf_01929 [Armadillidium vulgare]|nr:hypothetical protein Avbf_01929 [Armadillidium vulgare]